MSRIEADVRYFLRLDENDSRFVAYDTYGNKFIDCPVSRIVFNDAALCQEGNFDGVDSFLLTQHAFDSLVTSLISSQGRQLGRRTSTQDPQVMPSIRSSHLSDRRSSRAPSLSAMSSGSEEECEKEAARGDPAHILLSSLDMVDG